MVFDGEGDIHETFKRHRPTPPTDISLAYSGSLKIATYDLDQVKEEVLDERDINVYDNQQRLPYNEHARARADADEVASFST